MPNQDEIALAKYRIEKAKNCLNASKLPLDEDFMQIVQTAPIMQYFIQ